MKTEKASAASREDLYCPAPAGQYNKRSLQFKSCPDETLEATNIMEDTT